MRYLGNKRKLAKHLIPIMLASRQEGQAWVEPFVGGANMIDKVGGIRIGNDSNRYLIALLKAVKNGWIPPTEISREFYYEIKAKKEDFPWELVGFVGFGCSFGGKWFGSYAINKNERNYARESSNSLVKQSKNIRDVTFSNTDYRELQIPANSLIYCDPPYFNTAKYKHEIDHNEFWQWCRDKKNEGHTVFISELDAPPDFECVLAVDVVSTLNKNKKQIRNEKLFTLNK